MNRRDAIRLLSLAALACGAAAKKTTTMQTRPIPSSGEQLPIIGLGTWQTFNVAPESYAPLEEVLREFVSLGGKLIDSSPMYGRSEETVGDIADKAGVHEKLFLATKVWTSGKQSGIAQMADSMRKLRTKRVDLMQVHNLVDAETHLATLRAWKKEGRIRYLGITHYTSGAYGQVEAMLRKVPVDFLQINYSVGEREAEKRLLPLAREKGIAVIGNRPFAEGALLRRLSMKPLPDFAKEIDCTSWAQLLLKFVVSHPAITAVIPATSKVKHLRDNMAAGSGPMPHEALRQRIAASVTG
ncbi:MAG TPA: aldo/keto reductase [Thermoanaerobaculia bacterium]